MQLLKERILKDGVVKPGNILKVDSFLNHQMDIDLINEIGKEFKARFADCPITKILTIEASGIGIACIAAQYFHVPVVFAKKSQSVNLDGEMYCIKIELISAKRILSNSFMQLFSCFHKSANSFSLPLFSASAYSFAEMISES